MQALSILPLAPAFFDSDEFAPISANFPDDLRANLKIEDEHDQEEQEFSFICKNPQGSLISADEIFDNGKIRPIFPAFNQPLLFADEHNGASHLRPPLGKLFVEQRCHFPSQPDELRRAPEKPYCDWSRKTVVEGSFERCKKSNSTGLSKLWRLHGLKLWSNSDSKDAFVFLHPPAAKKPARSGEGKNVGVKKDKGGRQRKTTSLSAHEKHYVMNRARKESEKRKSYLPYRKQLVGFFANVNGFTRNLHPF